jgi:hypothetical protein
MPARKCSVVICIAGFLSSALGLMRGRDPAARLVGCDIGRLRGAIRHAMVDLAADDAHGLALEAVDTASSRC